MLKVMIAEDNVGLCSSCFEYLTKDEEIKVVSCVHSGDEALKKYLEIKPDVLILDLNLPKMSGIEIINNLNSSLEERKKCNIIVFSASTDLLQKLFNTAKVFKVILKPVNLEYLLETVKEVNIEDKKIDQKELKKLLTILNLKVYSKNTETLIETINIAFEKPYLLNNVKDIYMEVAKKHNTNYKSIKWSIRNSIDTLNRTISTQKFCTLFSLNYDLDSITPKSFISIVVQHFS